MIGVVRAMVARWGGRTPRGQAMVSVAIMMFTLIAFAALATDTDLVWANRRGLQNAADAAALAGVQELTQNPAKARDVACDYAKSKNRIGGMIMDCTAQTVAVSDPCNAQPNRDIQICRTYVPADSIRVTVHKRITPIFGMAVGWKGFDLAAHAIAMVGSLETVCAFPLFQTEDLLRASGAWEGTGSDFVEYNVPAIMKTSADGNAAGNFLALQINGTSNKDLWKDTVSSPGGCSGQTSGTADTSTGNYIGPFDQGMAARAGLWNSSTSPGYCPSISPTVDDRGIAVHPAGHPLAGQALTPENCYRMVKIPLMSGDSTTYTGTTTGTIRGFLVFYISNWCGQSSDPAKGTGSDGTGNDANECAAPAGTTLPELKHGELWGYYLKYEAITDLPINPYDGFGTKVVILIA